jgi:hypothetical protein
VVDLHENGTMSVFLNVTELIPRDEAEAETRPAARGASAGATEGDAMFTSRFQPGEGENVLATPAQDVWVNRLAKYKRRKASRAKEALDRTTAVPVGPVVPGLKNWAPLGPSVVVTARFTIVDP